MPDLIVVVIVATLAAVGGIVIGFFSIAFVLLAFVIFFSAAIHIGY